MHLEIVLAITAMIASLCSCFVSCFHAFLDYKRSMEQKDELWDTAVKLALRSGGMGDPDEVVQFYDELRFFKEHPEDVRRCHTIANAMREAAGREEARRS